MKAAIGTPNDQNKPTNPYHLESIRVIVRYNNTVGAPHSDIFSIAAVIFVYR